MKKPAHFVPGNKPVKHGLFFFLPVVCLFLFSSCAAVSPQQPKEDFQIALLEKQINEMDKKLDEIYHRVSIIQFMIDNHERKLKDFEKRKPDQESTDQAAGTDTEIPVLMEEPPVDLTPPEILQEQPLAAQSPADPQPPAQAEPQTAGIPPETMYNNALALYKNGDYDKAISDFNSFADQYPNNDLADNALYWSGECYYARKNYSAAIVSFKKVVTRYPEGSKIPDAFLKTGYAYLAMGDKENARMFLKKVIKNFPFSPAGSKAEEMLSKIK
jgi:tol-pal system protein YbgF